MRVYSNMVMIYFPYHVLCLHGVDTLAASCLSETVIIVFLALVQNGVSYVIRNS